MKKFWKLLGGYSGCSKWLKNRIKCENYQNGRKIVQNVVKMVKIDEIARNFWNIIETSSKYFKIVSSVEKI